MSEDMPFDVEIVRMFDAPRERVYQAFTDADQIVRWYGPPGFTVPRDTVAIDPRVGGEMRLTMVSDADATFRSGVKAHFTSVVDNELLDCIQDWDGIPGQDGTWTNRLRVEFDSDNGKTRVVLREGPHVAGMAELGRQAWEMMLSKLATALDAPGPG